MESAHGCQEINLHYIHIIIYSFFSLHYITFLFFVLYCETHFYGHLSHSSTSLPTAFPISYISVLFLINIPRYYLCLRILFPSRSFAPPMTRLAIPRNCSEDKSQRPCCRNAIFCYSERYAQNFIGYSEITVVGNCIRAKAHMTNWPTLADVPTYMHRVCRQTQHLGYAMEIVQNVSF